MRINAKLIPLALVTIVLAACQKEVPPAPPTTAASSMSSPLSTPPVDSEIKKAGQEDEKALIAAGFKVIPNSIKFDNGFRVKVDLGCSPGPEFYVEHSSPISLVFNLTSGGKYEPIKFTTQPTAEEITKYGLCA